jgi:stage V sporulation protein B
MGLPTVIQQLALRSGAISLVKLIGFIARIFLFRLLGAEGIGLYQMAYSVYGLVLTVITGGFPTTLSLTVARNRNLGLKMFNIMIFFLAFVGGACGFMLYTFAPQIAELYGDDHLTFSIRCIAFAIPIVPILSLLRGFLQGVELCGYIAGSEVIEQVIRVSTMLFLVSFWMNRGETFAVGGAVTGAFTGGIAAFLFLLIILIFFSPKVDSYRHYFPISFRPFSLGSNIPLFFKMSLYISATRLILPISDFFDALIIPQQLQASGINIHQAIAIFGEITGIAATIAYMPTIVTSALSHILSPKIAADWQQKRKERFLWRSRLALEIGWLYGLGSALFLFFYARDLSILMSGTEEAANAIRYQALAPLIGGMREITTMILWAMEKKRTPLVGLGLGIFCSLLLNLSLVSIPGFGYEGATIGLLSLDFIATLWNLHAMKRYSQEFGSFFTLLLESTFLLFISFLCFQTINYILQAIQVPNMILTIGRISLAYSCILLYIFIRFLKVSRLSIFLW